MGSDARTPRVHLAVDNCFASKRWTRPTQWMELVRDLGLRCVEASADTEADPLYCGEDYMARWGEEVARCQDDTGVRVVNLYSGHGTYTTLGLGHTEESVRRRMLELWIKPMVRTAARLRAGLGFYCHAFADEVLQEPSTYAAKIEQLHAQLVEVAAFAAAAGVTVGVEQMYSPHQYPWTIEGARELIHQVFQAGGHPLYITIDTGHQTGQRRFRRPEASIIVERASDASGPDAAPRSGDLPSSAGPAFGLVPARRTRASSGAWRKGRAFPAGTWPSWPRTWTATRSSSPLRGTRIPTGGSRTWDVSLRSCTSSRSRALPLPTFLSPKPPTEAASSTRRRSWHPFGNRARGRCPAGFPPPPEDLYLTLEIFADTAETPSEILGKLRESVRFWRRYVPEDGVRLEDLDVPGVLDRPAPERPVPDRP